MSNLSIVIPCYNEKENLPLLVNKIIKFPGDVKFYIVDNGSTDGTNKIWSDLSKSEKIRYLKQSKNSGYGSGIKFGLKHTDTEFVGWMHADLQQEISVLLPVLDFLSKNREMNKERQAIKGLRTGRSLNDLFFTWGMSAVMTTLFMKIHWDVAGQPTVLHRSKLNLINSGPNDFSLDFYIYNKIVMEGITFIRFNAPFGKRARGVSTWNTSYLSKLKHILRSLKFIMNLRLRLIK